MMDLAEFLLRTSQPGMTEEEIRKALEIIREKGQPNETNNDVHESRADRAGHPRLLDR